MIFSTSLFANITTQHIESVIKSKKVNISKNTKDEDPEVTLLQRSFYFIFVFRSTCPHCHKFVPILKDFSETFGVQVKAYSFDGRGIEGFTSKPLTSDLYQLLYQKGGFKAIVPALYLVNKDTLEIYPAIFGEATAAQLAMRVHQLLKHVKESHDA